jgi:hypothetical protein
MDKETKSEKNRSRRIKRTKEDRKQVLYFLIRSNFNLKASTRLNHSERSLASSVGPL